MLGLELLERFKIILLGLFLLIVVIIEGRLEVIDVLSKVSGQTLAEASYLETVDTCLSLLVDGLLGVCVVLVLGHTYLFVVGGLYSKESLWLVLLVLYQIIAVSLVVFVTKDLSLLLRDGWHNLIMSDLVLVEEIGMIAANYGLLKKLVLGQLLVYEGPVFIELLRMAGILGGVSLFKFRGHIILLKTFILMVLVGLELSYTVVLILAEFLIYDILCNSHRWRELKRPNPRTEL